MKIRVKKRKDFKASVKEEGEDSVPARRIQAEEAGAAGDQKRLYCELFRGLYDAVLIVDEEGGVQDANMRAEKFFSCSTEELCEMNVSELVVGMNPRMLEKVSKNIAQGRYTVLNTNCVRKNGDSFAAEIALSRVVFDGVNRLVFSIRNESRRDHVRTQLRTEHNALQNAASAILAVDRKGKIELANNAFVKMWNLPDKERATRISIADLWMDPDQASDLVKKLESNQNWGGELLAVKQNGAPFWVQATIAPNHDETGQVVGMVCSFIDISERYQAEESIRKEVDGQIDQARKKDEFAGLLNIITIQDLFQLIDSTGKSGRLIIRDWNSEEMGEVRFSRGKVVSAVAEDLRDKDAILKIFRDGGESFEFKRGEPDAYPDSIRESTMGILLEASRMLDEER